MNLWNRFKYMLLTWLLDDICLKGDCETCPMAYEANVDSLIGPACMQNEVHRQAREVWDLEED